MARIQTKQRMTRKQTKQRKTRKQTKQRMTRKQTKQRMARIQTKQRMTRKQTKQRMTRIQTTQRMTRKQTKQRMTRKQCLNSCLTMNICVSVYPRSWSLLFQWQMVPSKMFVNEVTLICIRRDMNTWTRHHITKRAYQFKLQPKKY